MLAADHGYTVGRKFAETAASAVVRMHPVPQEWDSDTVWDGLGGCGTAAAMDAGLGVMTQVHGGDLGPVDGCRYSAQARIVTALSRWLLPRSPEWLAVRPSRAGFSVRTAVRVQPAHCSEEQVASRRDHDYEKRRT
jgi:hypothetical protein